MKHIFGLFALLLIGLAPLAFADTAGEKDEMKQAQKEAHGKALEARSAHLSCEVDIAKAHLDMAALPDASSQKSTLESDYAKVKNAASGKDNKAFDQAAGALREDLKKARESVMASRKAEKEKKNQSMALDKEAFKAAQDAFKQCQQNAMKQEVEAVRLARDNQFSQWQKHVDNLKAKGVDTTKLQKLLDSAKEQKDNLESGLSNDNPQAVRDAMKQWRSMDLHLQANGAILRLQAAMAKAQDKAKEYNVTLDLSAVQATLDKAASMAQPGHEYAPGEFDQVWNLIKQASKQAQDALKHGKETAKINRKSNRQATQEQRKEMRDQNREQRKAGMEKRNADREARINRKDNAKGEKEDSAGANEITGQDDKNEGGDTK